MGQEPLGFADILAGPDAGAGGGLDVEVAACLGVVEDDADSAEAARGQCGFGDAVEVSGNFLAWAEFGVGPGSRSRNRRHRAADRGQGPAGGVLEDVLGRGRGKKDLGLVTRLPTALVEGDAHDLAELGKLAVCQKAFGGV
ncbi:hypothetical protein ACWGH2_36010 [Streptomyces sp. NPDC054871]